MDDGVSCGLRTGGAHRSRLVFPRAWLGRGNEIFWPRLDPSRTWLPIVGALGTDDLDVLHHAAVFVAKNVAVEHKHAGEVDGQLTDSDVAEAAVRWATLADRHLAWDGRHPIAIPRHFLCSAGRRALLLGCVVIRDRACRDVSTALLPLTGCLGHGWQCDRIPPYWRIVRQERYILTIDDAPLFDQLMGIGVDMKRVLGR
jgi:hypothetical protein